MTIKMIAEAAGVSVDTVQRKAKELFSDDIRARQKSNFTQAQSIQLMGEIRKKNFVELPQNAAELPQNAVSLDEAFKAAVIGLTAMVGNLDSRMSKIENKIEQRQALLPAPQIKPRDHISKIVREYATRKNIEYQSAWGELYTEFAYRTNSNPRTSAKNRKMAIIDYIDAEGQIDTLEAIAIDYMM